MATSQYLLTILHPDDSLDEISDLISHNAPQVCYPNCPLCASFTVHQPVPRPTLVSLDRDLAETEQDLGDSIGQLYTMENRYQTDITNEEGTYQAAQRGVLAGIRQLEEEERRDEEHGVHGVNERRLERNGRRQVLEAQLAEQTHIYQARRQEILNNFDTRHGSLQRDIDALRHEIRDARELIDGYLRFYQLAVAGEMELARDVWERFAQGPGDEEEL